MAASAWTTAPARALDVLADERLARLASRGDERAFSVLFARHQAGLTRYCRTVLRHQADAEDAAQNAMLAALRALEGGTVPLRVRPWLYRIAHHEALALVRARRPAVELDEADLPTATDPAEAGEVRRRLAQLISDLRSLSERQREALVLRELCGMGYAEIAESLGTSRAAAQQTVFEARSALQQFGEGRALDCAGIQRALSDRDGMRLRTRRVRAHLRGCGSCRAFETALAARRRDLGLLFPPSTAGGALAALARWLGGGGGEPLLAGLGLKGAALGLAVLAGGGAVVATTAGGGRDEPRPPALRAAPVADGVPAGAQPRAAAVRTASSREGVRPAARSGAGRRAAVPARRGRRPYGGELADGAALAAAAPVLPGAPGVSGTPAPPGGAGAVRRDVAPEPRGPAGADVPAAPVHTPAPPPAVAGTVGAVQGAVEQAGSGAVDAITEAAAGVVAPTAPAAAEDPVGTLTGALPRLP